MRPTQRARSKRRGRQILPVAAILGVVGVLLVGHARAEEVICSVSLETADGVYVDAGRDDGLHEGAEGYVERDGQEAARVRVTNLTRGSALCRIVERLDDGEPLEPGFLVRLYTTAEPEPEPGLEPEPGMPAPVAEPTSTRRRLFPRPRSTDSGATTTTKRRRLFPSRRGRDAERPPARRAEELDDDFVPLLAGTRARRSVGLPDNANILRGRIRLRQTADISSESDRDIYISRATFDGRWGRIGGSAWAFEWQGDLSYRFGPGFENSRQDEIRPNLQLFVLEHPLGDDGQLRLGRFIPRALPGVGFLDGALAEIELAEGFRLGGILGLKPERVDLIPSVDEPTAVAYATLEMGERPVLYYTGTAGLLVSLFDGEVDRLSLLLDQRLEVTKNLSFFTSAQVDADVGGAAVKEGVVLARLNAFASWRITDWLRTRVGVDHFERSDNRAERDLLEIEDEAFLDDIFDGGSWRYFVNLTQYLPWGIRLSEDISYNQVDGSDDDDVRWRVSLSKRGLPWLPGASVSMSVFSGIADGYGGLISASVPLADGRVSLRPSASCQFLTRVGDEDETFKVTRISLAADWRITDAWTVFGQASHRFGADADGTLLEIGLDFRF